MKKVVGKSCAYNKAHYYTNAEFNRLPVRVIAGCGNTVFPYCTAPHCGSIAFDLVVEEVPEAEENVASQ